MNYMQKFDAFEEEQRILKHLMELEEKIKRYEKAIKETLEDMNGYDRFRYGDKLEEALKEGE